MSKKRNMFDRAVQKSRFSAGLFIIYFVVFLILSGVHVGLIILMNRLHLDEITQSIIPLIYWALAALSLTLFTRKQVRDTFEEPMRELAEATMNVANGDFSVYVPTLHTADKFDYLDYMILDFNKMVEELGSIETLKTDFVSNVSHEMKTPIAIMKNYAELLQTDHITEEQRREYAASIEHASVKLSNLISNILKLNKLENQRIVAEASNYDVCRQVCDCILQLEEVWEEKGIKMDVDLEEAVYVFADENLMELVWNNLLSNAIKFTEPRGSIKVTQVSDGQWIKVSVSDTGCGMSEEALKHIFDKFYQGDTSHSKEGNGLGLALVKRVLELMNGEIEVISEREKGSTFTVTLPVAATKKESRKKL